MKRCPRCDRTHPETDSQCPYCHYREEEPAQVASHIDFLLGEIPQWVNRNWLDREKASLLNDVYMRRRNSLRPQAGPTAPLVASRPPLVVEKRPEAPAAPAARRVHPMATFLEEQNISYWHLIGAVLLLAGLSGLVRYTWDTAGKYLVFVLMIAATAGFYALGRILTRQNHIATGWALRAVAMVLVPLDLIAINAFALSGLHLSVNTIGLLTAGLCLPLYAWAAVKERLRCFDINLSLAIAATLHFALQTILPHIIAIHSPLATYAAYGFFYLPVALVYFVAARMVLAPGRRIVWLASAHAMALGSVILAIWPSGGRTLGDASATVLLAAALYTATAFLIDEPLYPWLSSLLTCIGLSLAISRHGAASWYWYAILSQAAALAAMALSRIQGSQSRQHSAFGYQTSAWTLAILSLVIQDYGPILILGAIPHFVLARADLYGAIFGAILSLGFFAWLRIAPLARVLVAYLFVLVGLVIARLLPHGVAWHDTPQVGLPLALAALVFLFTEDRRRRSAIVACIISLAISCIYAAMGEAFGFTLFTLALLVAVAGLGSVRPADGEGPIERQAMLWTTAVAAVAGVLLWETRLLPFLHDHLSLEENYGYGLVPLIALAVAHGSYWRSRNERLEDGLAPYQIAGTIAVMGVAIQLYDSGAGLPYSPLILLGLGIVAAGIYAARFRSLIAAGSTALLVLMAFIAYLLFLGAEGISTLLPHPLASAGAVTANIHETILIAIFFVSSALFAAIGTNMRMRFYIALSEIAGVAGFLYADHLIWHPEVTAYALALLAISALFSAMAHVWLRVPTGLWYKPLRDTSLLISVLSIPIALWPTLSDPSRPFDPLSLWCLLGCGLLWGCIAVTTRDILYTYLSAFAISGAYLYGLWGHIHSTGVIGFDLAIGALAWAGAAILLAFVTKVRKEVTSALHHVATALIFIALGFALFGDNRNQSELHTLLVASAVFFLNLWRTRAIGWQHAGVGALLWAYFLLLSQQVSGINYDNCDFYCAPVGAYLLLLGFLERQRARAGQTQSTYQFYYVAGLLLVMLPTLIAIHEARAQAFRAPLLATECVLAIFYGLTARLKAFIVGGTAFLIALIAVEASGNVSTIAWAIYATILGLVVIGSALFIERRRDHFTRWSQSVREKLKEWE